MRQVVYIVLVAVFCFAGRPGYLSDMDSHLLARMATHHLFHANVFHLAANCLSIWFVLSPRRSRPYLMKEMAAAYVLASLSYLVAFRPVIGVSNMLFATLGLRTPAFSNPWWRSTNTLVFFAFTLAMLLVPQFSAVTHIVSFLLGTLAAAAARGFRSLGRDVRRATGK